VLLNPGPLRRENEFASVLVELDLSAAGPRLQVKDLGSEMSNWLDPLELQMLACVRHADLVHLVESVLNDSGDR